MSLIEFKKEEISYLPSKMKTPKAIVKVDLAASIQRIMDKKAREKEQAAADRLKQMEEEINKGLNT
jgi:hypothetical protein